MHVGAYVPFFRYHCIIARCCWAFDISEPLFRLSCDSPIARQDMLHYSLPTHHLLSRAAMLSSPGLGFPAL